LAEALKDMISEVAPAAGDLQYVWHTDPMGGYSQSWTLNVYNTARCLRRGVALVRVSPAECKVRLQLPGMHLTYGRQELVKLNIERGHNARAWVRCTLNGEARDLWSEDIHGVTEFMGRFLGMYWSAMQKVFELGITLRTRIAIRLRMMLHHKGYTIDREWDWKKGRLLSATWSLGTLMRSEGVVDKLRVELQVSALPRASAATLRLYNSHGVRSCAYACVRWTGPGFEFPAEFVTNVRDTRYPSDESAGVPVDNMQDLPALFSEFLRSECRSWCS
jgi:hypothetical protein